MFTEGGGTKSVCAGANDLMMKFMDGKLDEADETRLLRHVKLCAKCEEDFAVYTKIAAEFTACGATILAAPPDFEENVMKKVQALGDVARKNALDNVILGVVGVFSALFGIGFFFFINKDSITDYFRQSNAFGAYAEAVAPFSAVVDEFVRNMETIFNEAAASTSNFLGQYKFVLIGVCVVVFVLLFAVRGRSTATVYANDVPDSSAENDEKRD